jgi:hypothetical protein
VTLSFNSSKDTDHNSRSRWLLFSHVLTQLTSQEQSS